MLQTIKELVNLHENVKFVACGTGVLKDKMMNRAKKLGIEKYCKFLGYRKDISKIMQISNFFLHSSHQEGLTLSVLEAMYMGLPCVVSNVRGNRDLIDDGLGGFVVEQQDYKTFAEKINTLILNPDLAKKMSEYNQKKSKDYTIEKVKEQLREIYKNID